MKTTCRSLEMLQQAMVRNNTLVCCGLDPDIEKIPLELRGGSSEDAILRFLEIVVDLTAPHVCSYKAQKAFFDIWPNGHELLRQIIAYIHEHYPQLPVFVDAKIGDIGNTMEIYLRNIFGELNADGVVVNPYLGDDVMMPFTMLPDKAVIVTVKTSNPAAALVQDVMLQDGRPLWEYLLDLTVNRWNGAENMVPVVAATSNFDLTHVRRLIPDGMPVFFAGYGAQGGTTKHLRQLLDSSGRGVVVNSSRGLLYPYKVADSHWRDEISHAVQEMQNALNFERSLSKFLLLLGVSAAGKSTVIRELLKIDDRFVYIPPYMTRELRAGEMDKIAVTNEVMDDLEAQGKLLFVNPVYGVRYGTPREPIEQAFREGKFPLLDWPVDRMSVMKKTYSERLFTVYIEPQDDNTLRRRLSDGRDSNGVRYRAALTELKKVRAGAYDDCINHRAVSSDGDNEASDLAFSIYGAYIKAMG